MSIKEIDEDRAAYEHWADLTDSMRIKLGMPRTLKEFARVRGISYEKAKGWYKSRNNRERKERELREKRGEDLSADFATVREEIEWKLKNIDKLNSADVAALRLRAEMYDLVGKRKDTGAIQLTGDDYFRITGEVFGRILGELPSECVRDCPLLAKFGVLSEQIRLDSELQHGQEGEMAAVGLSTGPSKDVSGEPSSSDTKS